MNDGRSLESYVQFVFSSLLNMKDEVVVVGRNVQLVDKFGLAHRVDISDQFERAGITHKIAESGVFADCGGFRIGSHRFEAAESRD